MVPNFIENAEYEGKFTWVLIFVVYAHGNASGNELQTAINIPQIKVEAVQGTQELVKTNSSVSH